MINHKSQPWEIANFHRIRAILITKGARLVIQALTAPDRCRSDSVTVVKAVYFSDLSIHDMHDILDYSAEERARHDIRGLVLSKRVAEFFLNQ